MILITVAGLAAVTAWCYRAAGRGPTAADLAMPDVSSFDPVVREQIEAARQRAIAPDAASDAVGELAMILHAYGLRRAAKECYAAAIRRDADDPRWHYLFGRVLSDQGDKENARKQLERTVRLRPDYAAAWIQLGELRRAAGDIDGALTAFDEAGQRHPSMPQAYFLAGSVEAERNRLPQAVAHFQKALQLAPRYAQARYSLAMTYRDLGDEERARNNLELFKQTEGAPPLPDPWMDAVDVLRRGAREEFGIAHGLAKEGRYAEAVEHYRASIRLDPQQAEAHFNLAVALIRLGKPQEALPHVETTLRIKPNYARAQSTMGYLLAGQGRRDEAMMHYRRSIELAPEDVAPRTNFGNFLDRIGRSAEAVEHYQAAIRLAPADPTPRINLGNVLVKLGRADEAIDVYREALRLRPADDTITSSIASAMVAAGRAKEGIAFLWEATRRNPASMGLLEELAWQLATNPDEALRDPGTAVQLATRVCDATGRRAAQPFDTLAVALAAAGRFGEAVEAATQGRELARAARQTGLVAVIDEHLKLFRSGRSYVASSAGRGASPRTPDQTSASPPQ